MTGVLQPKLPLFRLITSRTNQNQRIFKIAAIGVQFVIYLKLEKTIAYINLAYEAVELLRIQVRFSSRLKPQLRQVSTCLTQSFWVAFGEAHYSQCAQGNSQTLFVSWMCTGGTQILKLGIVAFSKPFYGSCYPLQRATQRKIVPRHALFLDKRCTISANAEMCICAFPNTKFFFREDRSILTIKLIKANVRSLLLTLQKHAAQLQQCGFTPTSNRKPVDKKSRSMFSTRRLTTMLAVFFFGWRLKMTFDDNHATALKGLWNTFWTE